MLHWRISRHNLITLLFIVLLMWTLSLSAQELGTADTEKKDDAAGLVQYMEEGMKEIDFYSLEELLNVEVEVASLFTEDELVVGSTVSSISPDEWTRLGAKRTHDAFENQLNVVVYPNYSFVNTLRIRGFAGTYTGISWLVDGIPATPFSTGYTDAMLINWGLGTLNGIEMIKGPGSAIYGSDAFHGVVSLNTYESEKNEYSLGIGGGYPFFYDGNIKISQGLYDDFIRFDIAAAASGQGDREVESEFDDPTLGYGTLATAEDKNVRKDKYNTQTGVLKATIKPFDKLKIKVGGYVSRFEGEEGAGAYSYGTDLYLRKTVEDHFGMFKMGKGSIVYNIPNKIDLEVNGYYWEGENTYEMKFDEDLYPILNAISAGFIGFSATPTTVKGVINDTRTGTNLIIKQKDNSINLQWVAGYSYTKMHVPNTSAEAKIADTDEYVPFTQGQNQGKLMYDGKSRNINSGFIQLKWGTVPKKLYLIAGSRLDYYSDFGNQFTPRGGIIFLPTEKSSIKALYGRAFRAGTADEVYGGNWTVGNKDIEPETIDIYELVYILKSTNGKINVNGFYSSWKNGIGRSPNPDETSPYEWKFANTAESRAYGGELSAYYSFKPFAVNLGFAYAISEELNIPDQDNPSEKMDREYTAFPEYSAIAGLYYTLEPYKINFLLNNRILKNMTEVPAGNELFPESDDLPLYWRMDLNVSKNITGKFDISLNVNNVLNRKNAVSSYTGYPDGISYEPGIYTVFRCNYKI